MVFSMVCLSGASNRNEVGLYINLLFCSRKNKNYDSCYETRYPLYQILPFFVIRPNSKIQEVLIDFFNFSIPNIIQIIS